ncbi:hypothetical protein GDO86_015978 [Hymenochirus boettgeri]|uniref:Nucleoside-diphosphate kinase n=1 Tax=Hymenochirus boettgeri TaxID=247094 RepID=A0A8T2JYK1_9PIPI|nr:hypothetical protein GDO86_015978 [Hymenochirus boettgeri]
MNHIDSFAGRNIGKYLCGCLVGASLVESPEEAEDDDSGSVKEDLNQKQKGLFQIVGTLSNPNGKKMDFPLETYMISSRDEFLQRLLECDIIVFNITEDLSQLDDASWAVSALHSEINNFANPKMFILISTILTWARSKPIDPDDPEIPFTEDDYRRRKCHINFKDHLSVEKLVIKLGKTEAWLGETHALPVFGDGLNYIPLMHITDLASVVQNIADQRPRTHYLVAVDDSVHTLEEIVKCISINLGPGKIQRVPRENIFLRKELTQLDIDYMLVNLRMEAVFLKENFNINWVTQSGLVDNIQSIITEYKQTRGLQPIRICILGPPAVGKTSMSEIICKYYKLHHIKIKDVITEAMEKLERLVKSSEEEEEGEENEEQTENWQEILYSVKENMEQHGGRLDDSYVIKFMKEKLKSMPCQNQGYVLDGYPKTYDQAKELFNLEEREEEDEARGKAPPFDKTITPDFVFSLDASDEYLKNRVINLPESIVAGTHYAQERFLRTLAVFRDLNTEDETVLNYFDEAEIHPLHIDVSKDDDPQYKGTLIQICKVVGESRNYGLTAEELADQEIKAAEESFAHEAKRKDELQRKEAEEAAEKIARWEEWNKRLEEVKRQEQELLEAQSVPLRNYLMKNVMPTLVQGLNECCKVRPDDPVDFLAEYIFRNNPQIE